LSIALKALTVAPLIWHHGHEHALKAIALLRDRLLTVEYTLIGDGPDLRAVYLARHQLGLSESVRISRKRFSSWMLPLTTRVDIYVCAAVAPVDHPVPNSAIRRGIPIVCTDVVARFIAASARSRLHVVPRWDAAAMADCIASLAGEVNWSQARPVGD
jgi:glycosyltransferase involved in cell wall biosynthesis